MNTMQQEFDAVVSHLFTQGKPALSKPTVLTGPGCYYRLADEDGTVLKCAVGCRIPDDKYKPEMDISNDSTGTGLGNLIDRFKEDLPAEIVEYSEMFDALQGVHDTGTVLTKEGNFDPERLATRLAKVAASHGLTFTRPQGE